MRRSARIYLTFFFINDVVFIFQIKISKMSDGYRSQEINSTTPLIDKEYGSELTPILRNDDNHSIAPNDISSDENSNSIRNRFQKIFKKLDYLHVETRGIERVLPEDRTDLKIIDEALLWVTYTLYFYRYYTAKSSARWK